MHVASILLREQSMMGCGSGAWGNMSEKEENGGKGRMGLAVVLVYIAMHTHINHVIP